jgi:hypothetical protein
MARIAASGESPKAYDEMAGRAAVWQWVSRDLLAAANAVQLHRRGPGARQRKTRRDDRVDTSPAPILLLYGLALETLLKGVLIAQGTPATRRGRLNRDLRTHNLVKLWKEAGLAIDTDQETLLSALAWIIETGGRYPMGLHPDPTAMTYLSVGMRPVECIVALFTTAEQALRQSLPDAPFKATNLVDWGV